MATYILELSNGVQIQITDESTVTRVVEALGEPDGRFAPLDIGTTPNAHRIIPAHVARIQRVNT